MHAAHTCPAKLRLQPARRPAFLAALTVLALATPLLAQTDPDLPPPSELKMMRIDQLMDIDVTSVSKHAERLWDSASAIQVITGDDINQSGATSIPEALRIATNLEVAQIDSHQWAITSRGFNNVFADKMLVLMDGRTVYTPLYAGVYWDVQSTLMEDLDRIEVISGPGATQWGSNAVNGVINITTKSAKDTQGGLVSAELGTQLKDDIGVRYGGELAPGVYYRVYAKYFDHNDTKAAQGIDPEDEWNMGQGGFRIDWTRSPDNTLTFQGDLYGGAIDTNGPDQTGMNGRNLLGRWTQTYGENSDLQVQAYYDHTHRSIPESFTQTLDTYDVDVQRKFMLGNSNLIVYGLGYRDVDDDITNTPAQQFLPPHVSRSTYNAFAQDEITLLPDVLHFTGGTKVEHNDYTGWEIEPSGRFSWTPNKQQTVWTAVSRAVRTPSRVDSDLFSPKIDGGPDVVSEVLVAYELGYRVQVTSRFNGSVATYYNVYDDLSSLEPVNPPSPFPVERSNGFEGHSTGAELTADYQVNTSWRLRAGYNELRVHTSPQPGTLATPQTRSNAHDPNHQASLRSMLDLSSSWEFDADLRYVSQIANQSLPGYTEMGLRLGWHPVAAWEFSVDGQNLLHSKHAEFNTPGSRREIPRSVYGKTVWRF